MTQDATGSEKKKTAPRPNWLVTPMLPTMQFDNSFGDCQTHAGAVDRGSLISSAIELLENHRLLKVVNAGAEDELRKLIANHTANRQLGFLGEPRVNVLELNIDLDTIHPLNKLTRK